MASLSQTYRTSSTETSTNRGASVRPRPAVSVDSPAPRRQRSPMTVARLAAVRFAQCLGLPLTFRNLYVIELAIEAESEFRRVSIGEAAEIIRDGAMAEAVRGGELNYFFFEDCRWRYPKLNAAERRERANRLAAEEAKRRIDERYAAIRCHTCNDMGFLLNPWATCAAEHTIPCPDCDLGRERAARKMAGASA